MFTFWDIRNAAQTNAIVIELSLGICVIANLLWVDSRNAEPKLDLHIPQEISRVCCCSFCLLSHSHHVTILGMIEGLSISPASASILVLLSTPSKADRSTSPLEILCQRMRLRSFWNVPTPLWSWRGLKYLAIISFDPADLSWQVPGPSPPIPHLHVLFGGSFQATLAHGHRSAALRWQHANFQLLVVLWHVDRERVTQLRCWQVYLQNLASHGSEEQCAVESDAGHSWAIHKNIELQASLKKVRGSS